MADTLVDSPSTFGSYSVAAPWIATEEDGMVTLSVNGSERVITNRSDIDEAWIASQIVGRRKDGQSVCVLLRIDGGEVNLKLASAGCGGGAKGGRPPRPQEQRVLEAWRERGLTEEFFPPGALISFLHQLVGSP